MSACDSAIALDAIAALEAPNMSDCHATSAPIECFVASLPAQGVACKMDQGERATPPGNPLPIGFDEAPTMFCSSVAPRCRYVDETFGSSCQGVRLEVVMPLAGKDFRPIPISWKPLWW